jgi:hypothetical protein
MVSSSAASSTRVRCASPLSVKRIRRLPGGRVACRLKYEPGPRQAPGYVGDGVHGERTAALPRNSRSSCAYGIRWPVEGS